VVFPLLLMVALGLVQFALYVHAQNVITAAAEDSARIAAEAGNHDAGASQRARDVVRAGLGTGVQPTVTVSGIPANNPDRVEVTVRARERMVLPWVPWDPNISLESTARMDKERFRANP
jgi:Flp pilus assembly protein TadG